MSIGAVVSVWTFLFLLYILAEFRVVDSVPSSIFGGMVVDAVFVIVIFGDVAGRYFEDV